MGSELEDELRGHVGASTGGLRVGRDPVNLPMIHHWVQALQDGNPVYVDAERARASRHGGLVAPPGMLQTWTQDAAGRDGPVHTNRDDEPGNPAIALLDEAGYTAVVATDYSHEYARELRPGDRVCRTARIEEVSALKRTALGPGFFVTMRYDYVDEAGEPLGVGRMRLLKYRPEPRPDQAPAGQPAGQPAGVGTAARPRPAINRDNAHFWAGARRGELLIQRCTSCGVLRHPPGPMCGNCRGTGWDTVAAVGTGTIHSFVVHHHPPLPGFPVPHVPVLVELAEGVRVVSHLTGGFDPAEVRIGMPVSVVFTELDDELTLPLFEISPDAEPVADAAAREWAGTVFDKVAVGDELPPLRIEATASRIVATALASRDFEAVHHDRAEARRRGTRDIFFNILTSNGYALRYVTDWAGPEAVVTAAAIRLGVPCYAGDTLRLTGRVEAAAPVAGSPEEGRLVVAVKGRNSLGVHVHGTVTLTLPRGEGR